MKPRPLLLATMTAALSGCWHVWPGQAPGECLDGVTVVSTDYLGAPLRLEVPDDSALDAATQCTRRFEVLGFAPCGGDRTVFPKRHPVVVFVPGTIQPHGHAFIMRTLKRIAQSGFVAVSVDYANLSPAQGCGRYRPRAACLFDDRFPQSALRRICDAIPQADCDAGIAVMGHSQGGAIAVLGGNYNPRVRWVHAMGITAFVPGTDDEGCLLPEARVLPRERLFVACGECDIFFQETRRNTCSARSPGVTAGLIRLTGLDCGSKWRCLQPQGDDGPLFGWLKIGDHEVKDGEADHCYMFRNGCFGPTDREWERDPSLAFGLPQILEQLRRAFRRPAPLAP